MLELKIFQKKKGVLQVGCQSIFFIYFFQDDITTTITTATFQSLKVYHQKVKLTPSHGHVSLCTYQAALL